MFATSKVTKNVLRLILSLIFVWELIESIEKLRDGLPSTQLTEVAAEENWLPSITVCYQPGRIQSPAKTYLDGFRFAEEHLTFPVESIKVYANIMLDLQDKNFMKLNWMNRSSVEMNSFDFDSVWNDFYMSDPNSHNFVKCRTFNYPKKILPSVYLMIVLAVPLPPPTMIIKFHERGQIIHAFDRHLGASIILVNESEDQGEKIKVFEIKQKYIRKLNKAEAKCDQDNQVFIKECLEKYFIRKAKCQMPWMKYTDYYDMPVCQMEENFREFNNITRQIVLAKNMEEVSKMTGCYTNCNYVRFNAKFESENKANHEYSNNKTDSNFHFLMPEQAITLQNEKVTYDISCFVADFGGYLGLLLGLSIIDLYQLIISILKTCVDKTN